MEDIHCSLARGSLRRIFWRPKYYYPFKIFSYLLWGCRFSLYFPFSFLSIFLLVYFFSALYFSHIFFLPSLFPSISPSHLFFQVFSLALFRFNRGVFVLLKSNRHFVLRTPGLSRVQRVFIKLT